MNTLISVIVPCYNQAEFLPETLQSVLEQTYCNWECIVVDDGSSDNTEQVASEWRNNDSRFKYLKKQNGGLSSARNAGITYANGKIILPLDSDDLIHVTYLEKINNVFRNNPNLDLVSSRIQLFGINNNELILPNYSYKKQLVQNCFVCCSAFKKESWINVGGYDEKMTSFEDWEFLIRLLNEKSEVFKIPELLFFYRKHEKGSLSNNFKIDINYYNSLYDYVYTKNKGIYDVFFSSPINAFNENLLLSDFNNKIKNNFLFKLYVKIKNII